MSKAPDFGKVVSVVNGLWGKQGKSPKFTKEDLSLKKIPIWVQLRKIPLQYFHPKGVNYLASTIGKTLHMDRATTLRSRLDYAKKTRAADDKSRNYVADVCAAKPVEKDSVFAADTCAADNFAKEHKVGEVPRQDSNSEKRVVPIKEETSRADKMQADIDEEVESQGSMTSSDDELESVANVKEIRLGDSRKLKGATMGGAQVVLKMQGQRKSRTGIGGKPPKFLS
ncbi:hypothetical protein CRG98_015782 [Punica granatum]|uniref:Uncharacterized protein n=1 Tax=Punica granatum TaxID=22663 RepID=A0A2I0K5H9_PUNGR|nr:hypothetical protein CRG98_015782 [Punica granatum]